MRSWGNRVLQEDGLQTNVTGEEVRWCGVSAAEIVIPFSWCEGHMKGNEP